MYLHHIAVVDQGAINNTQPEELYNRPQICLSYPLSVIRP